MSKPNNLAVLYLASLGSGIMRKTMDLLRRKLLPVLRRKYIGSARRGILSTWISEAERKGRGVLIVITEEFCRDTTIWPP